MFSGSIPLELHQEINGVGVGQDRGRSRSEVETSSVSLKRRSMSASTGNFILAVSARGRFTIQRRAFIVSCQLRKQSLNGRVMVTVSGKDIVQGTVLSEVARPRRRNTAGSRVPLEAIFPSAFTDWRADLTAQTFVQPPDEHGKIYGIYDDVLERAYLDRAGTRIMLCVAYGSEQSPALELHRPEVCYQASGFQVSALTPVSLGLGARKLPCKPVWSAGRNDHYWTTLGDEVSDRDGFRWHQLWLRLSGEMHDGMLVRISSISRDGPSSYLAHARFAEDLLREMAPEHRGRVFGLSPDSRSGGTHRPDRREPPGRFIFELPSPEPLP